MAKEKEENSMNIEAKDFKVSFPTDLLVLFNRFQEALREYNLPLNEISNKNEIKCIELFVHIEYIEYENPDKVPAENELEMILSEKAPS